jgi:serine/threonine-protein kinase
MIGKTISHYRIVEKVGAGGMGVVYKAEDTKLHRTVALKFLPPGLTEDINAKARFVHEAQAASSLQHANICTIHDIDQTPDGQMFISMEYCEGETLKNRLAWGALEIPDAVDVTIQIAQGLAGAHSRSIVHRDIKPGNIIITTDGVVKIVDFGLAKLSGRTTLTRPGTTPGTVAYMSPEQAKGGTVDHRTDIWSVGVTLYEMITGELPFRAEYDHAVLYQIMNEDPRPVATLRAGVPNELERIVAKSLRKNPDERYPRIDELVVELKALKSQIETGRRAALPSSASPGGPRRRRRVPLYLGLGLAGAALSVAVFYYSQQPGKPIDSIAILPFKNELANPDVDYLSDGMTESIIKSLSGIPNLKKIIAYSSVLQYKQKEIDPRAVGKELGVGALLIGRVSQRGDELTISVELVNAEENTRLWGNQYTESFAKIFDIRDEISRAIADNLRLHLTQNDLDRLTRRQTANTIAYQDYLKGLYFVNRRSQADLKKSFDYFQEAIAQDPQFALPYTGLGDYYMTMGMYNLIPKDTAYAIAKNYLEKAVEIDPTESGAYALLADFKEYSDWDWAGGQEMLQRALELNPFDAYAHHRHSHMLTAVKRFDEATAEMKRALELEPLAVPTNSCFGQNLYLARRYDDAIQQLQKTIELDSTHYDPHGWLGMAYFQKGMHEEAIRQMEKAFGFEVNRARMTGALAYAYGMMGRRQESAWKLGELLNQKGAEYFDPYFVAWGYAGLGERDSVFVWLDKAYDERSTFLREMVTVDPWFDSLRADERFVALVKKVGF